MTIDQIFINELTKLMDKHNVGMYIDIDQDYAGVQNAELRFDTKESSGHLIFNGWDSVKTANDIRSITTKELKEKVIKNI